MGLAAGGKRAYSSTAKKKEVDPKHVERRMALYEEEEANSIGEGPQNTKQADIQSLTCGGPKGPGELSGELGSPGSTIPTKEKRRSQRGVSPPEEEGLKGGGGVTSEAVRDPTVLGLHHPTIPFLLTGHQGPR